MLQKSKLWQSMIRYWVIERGKHHLPSLVVTYENLKSNTAAEIGKILTYLDMEKSIDSIRALLKEGFRSVVY